MDRNSDDESKQDSRPSPADFDLYLPWACTQLQMQSIVQVTKVYQNEYVSAVTTDRSKKGKTKGVSQKDLTIDQGKEGKSSSVMTMKQVYDVHAMKIITVQAIYDFQDNLVQIKFVKNTRLPRVMIKVVGLIIQFYTYLNSIAINGGLDPYIVYEICKFLPTNNITELCLDDCYLKEPNYYLLLERENFLKCLSLCRCKIDDMTIQSLCLKLMHPLPASKTLSVLNLSSNRITDEGAKFIADFLRCNRQLSYLNLASNMITDDGASAIFNTLMAFPLTTEDVLKSKLRYMTHLKHKNDMVAATITELRIGDIDKKSLKRKSIRPTSTGLKKLKPDTSQKSLTDPIKCLADVDSALIEKAISIVENSIGDFIDPYSNYNTLIRDGITYCKGNNSLCCLNISYNYLSYLSLVKIYSALEYQKLEGRIPRGLLTVSVEGNCVPITCKELSLIDNILEINLTSHGRRMSCSKKRPHARSLR